LKFTLLGASDCTRVGIWSVDCANHSMFYNFMFLPDNANQTSIKNVLSYKLKTSRRNIITSVRTILMNSLGTIHVFIYIFHMIITINSPFYQLTPFNYVNQMHCFELVRTLDTFLLHVSALIYHLQGKDMTVFLKAKLVYICRNMWEKLSNVCTD
jgi:hypothetical protein